MSEHNDVGIRERGPETTVTVTCEECDEKQEFTLSKWEFSTIAECVFCDGFIFPSKFIED